MPVPLEACERNILQNVSTRISRSLNYFQLTIYFKLKLQFMYNLSLDYGDI